MGRLATGVGMPAFLVEQLNSPGTVVVGPGSAWCRQGPVGQAFVDQPLEGLVDDRAADHRSEVGPFPGLLEGMDAQDVPREEGEGAPHPRLQSARRQVAAEQVEVDAGQVPVEAG